MKGIGWRIRLYTPHKQTWLIPTELGKGGLDALRGPMFVLIIMVEETLRREAKIVEIIYKYI